MFSQLFGNSKASSESGSVVKDQSIDLAREIEAINRSQAVIHFNMDGTVITANENFLKTLGYRLDEIVGKHHSLFVDQAYRDSAEYRQFWRDLNDGRFQAAEYKRIAKSGREVWIQASYNPILDSNGRPTKVVKFATDVTAAKLQNSDYQGQIAAINKSQAVIEFTLDGTVINANENFLKTLGYGLSEIKGQHHRMFVESSYGSSAEYRQFWQDLNAGTYRAGEFLRIAKGGRSIWIQASYNPIFDPNGKPMKVIKFATDITEQVNAREDLRSKVNLMLPVISAAADGDLSVKVPVTGSDPIGQMSEAFASLLAKFCVSIDSIKDNCVSLAGASEELSASSTQMRANAEETSTQSGVVSAASEQVNRSTQTVATAVEEMTASIKEIAKNASDAAHVAASAVGIAQKTNAKITKLGESSQEIGDVIKVITSIAQQTNLLALNATIEAARAGEAGKGFAVVANEVKELAKETAKATENISKRIEAIQSDTKDAIEAIEEISGVINQINSISTAIAGAVEEQTATTNEIGRNVSESAKGAAEISENISSVAQAAKSTNEGATNSQCAAQELARMSADLQQIVEQFNTRDGNAAQQKATAKSRK